jgi:hypothetical protein
MSTRAALLATLINCWKANQLYRRQGMGHMMGPTTPSQLNDKGYYFLSVNCWLGLKKLYLLL